MLFDVFEERKKVFLAQRYETLELIKTIYYITFKHLYSFYTSYISTPHLKTDYYGADFITV